MYIAHIIYYSLSLCKHSSLFVNLVSLKCNVGKSSRLREKNLGLGCLGAYCCNMLDYSEISWNYEGTELAPDCGVISIILCVLSFSPNSLLTCTLPSFYAIKRFN